MSVPSIVLILAMIWKKSLCSDGKIVGGYKVNDIREYPYAVSIQIQINSGGNSEWEPHCSGTLVSALYVVTACHCVAKKDTPNGKVYPMEDIVPLDRWALIAGALDVDYASWVSDPQAQNRVPALLQYHPQCDLLQNQWLLSTVSVNDVGVAKTSEPFNLNPSVQPVNILTFERNDFRVRLEKIQEGSVSCTIVGWGPTHSRPALGDMVGAPTTSEPTEEPTDRTLVWTKLSIMNETRCFLKMSTAIRKATKDFLSPHFPWSEFTGKLEENLVGQSCTQVKYDSPCTSDFGSGLICEEMLGDAKPDSRKSFVGVTSWGVGCGEQQMPSVIQTFLGVLSWLKQVLCRSDTCQDMQYRIENCEPLDEDFEANCSFAKAMTTARVSTAETQSLGPFEVTQMRARLSAGHVFKPGWVMSLSFYQSMRHSL